MRGVGVLAFIIAVVLHFTLCQWQFVSVGSRGSSVLGGLMTASYLRGSDNVSFVSIPLGDHVLFIKPRRAQKRDTAMIFGIFLPIGIAVVGNVIGLVGSRPEEDEQVNRSANNPHTHSLSSTRFAENKPSYTVVSESENIEQSLRKLRHEYRKGLIDEDTYATKRSCILKRI